MNLEKPIPLLQFVRQIQAQTDVFDTTSLAYLLSEQLQAFLDASIETSKTCCSFGAIALASATSKADTASLQQLFQQAEVDRIVHETQLRGDPARGAMVFYTSAAACATCHGSGEGISPLGPDLSKLGRFSNACPSGRIVALSFQSDL